MSTKITAIRDTFKTLVAAALGSSYTQVPNPYSPELNNQIMLAQGWGIAVGPAQKVDLELCEMGFERSFNVILVRLNTAPIHDIVTKEAIELALLEDFQTIRKSVERDNNTLSGNAIKTDYIADSGIEFLQDIESQQKFFSINITFSVLYQESIA